MAAVAGIGTHSSRRWAWFDAVQPGGLTGPVWQALMEQGKCLLILDGVDEVQVLYKDGNEAHRPRANLLSGIADALPRWHAKGNRVLLTSRPYGLTAADRNRLKLAEAELLPLDGDLQQLFIKRWFAAVDTLHGQDKAEGLIGHLAGRDDLRELQESPMLLTALCVKYDEGRRLPRDIHALYHSVINQVLHGRYHDTVDQQAVRRRLAAVALGMHTGDPSGQARTSPEVAVSYRELELILTDYAGKEQASEDDANSAAEKREDLISHSGLLLPRGEEQAGFYHLSFQEYLAAERLDILRADLAECLRERAGVPEWRRTLVFLFSAVAETRPQVALDALREVLLPQLELARLLHDPNPAQVLLGCLEIAHDRRWALGDFTDVLKRTCTQSLQSELAAELRNTLWLGAGRLSVDDRLGIGLDGNGLPDIAWCEVPGGRVTLEDDGGEFAVGAFSIARYPVTNVQFEAFVTADDGYRDPSWWEPEWLEAGWVDPLAPPRPYWNQPNAPRETVSWHEAVAFCRWLQAHLFDQGSLPADRQLRLPTEGEWQLAATGGDPQRVYPWGPDWAPARLNTEAQVSRTTAVGIYPLGVSPVAALDMAGNVWEWCLNQYENAAETALAGSDKRVVRGGSWFYSRGRCRAAVRIRNSPDARGSSIGFRVCLSSPIVDR